MPVKQAEKMAYRRNVWRGFVRGWAVFKDRWLKRHVIDDASCI